MKSFIILVLFACLAFRVQGFENDSAHSDQSRFYKSVTYFRDADYYFDKPTRDTLNNSLDFFHQYNPVLKNQSFYKYLGNYGTVYQSMLYSNPPGSGFNSGLFDYDLYQTQPATIKYYDAKKRYSDLSYVLGARSEQCFKITHTQNINKYFNVGLDFQKVSSDAFFKNLKTEYTNFNGFTNIHSKNSRYFLLANYIFNRVDAGQNGGVVQDSVLELAEGVDNLFYPVNLPDARTKIKTNGAYLKQSFYFGFKQEIKVDDTLTTKVFRPSQGIFHSVLLEDKGYAYKEETSTLNFYRNVYYDSLQTRDSIYVRKLENKLSWFTLDNYKGNPEGKRYIKLSLIANHQLILYKQRSIDTMLNNTSLKAAMYSDINKFKWDLNGTYHVTGANENDYLLSGILKYELGADKSHIRFSAFNQKRSPSFIFNRFDSNHFIWSNKLDKATVISLNLSYHHPRYHFDIEAGASLISNYMYFGTDTLPQQYAKSFTINTVMVHKDFRFSRFVLANRVVYQKAGANVIRLPELASNHTFYYENKFFKKALLVHIGGDLRYLSGFYSDAYMPATGQFFLQDTRKVGDRYFIDVFINLQIKTARFFLKMEHINAPKSGYDANVVPFYPIPGPAFKFGISWQFFD